MSGMDTPKTNMTERMERAGDNMTCHAIQAAREFTQSTGGTK